MMPLVVRTRPRLDTCVGRFVAPSSTIDGRAAGGAEGRLQFVRRVSRNAARSQQPTARTVALPKRQRSDARIVEGRVDVNRRVNKFCLGVLKRGQYLGL